MIFEDAAHALGAHYQDGSPVGYCKFSDMTIFSFHPVKSITTGEGGVITTNNKKIYDKLKSLRSHGIERDKSKLNKKFFFSPWYYEMQKPGFHYRITDIQCALGLSQLKKLKKFINYRRKIANFYDKQFSKFKNCKPLQLNMRKKSANHLYVLKINFEKIKKSKKEVIKYLRSNNILTQVHYIPVTNHPYYSQYKKKNKLINTSVYYEQCLSIPIFFGLKKNQLKFIVKKLKKIIEE